MKTVLITAYAVHPYKGSEDAMGWNMIMQALRHHCVIAVTRKNNRAAIEQYIQAHPENEADFARLRFLYFDWPLWMLFWKKGPLLSMVYYYGWQFTLALWLLHRRLPVDVVHNLNFHNDWTPSFLWLLGKPFVWGHVGHHSKIPRQYLLPVYGKRAYLKDRLLWVIKHVSWYADPFLYLCRKKADAVICMNGDAVQKLRLKNNYIIHPSVAAGETLADTSPLTGAAFHILSVGRFVTLKGFDITVLSFALFYRSLPPEQQSQVKLTLLGSGPLEPLLRKMVQDEGVSHAVQFIPWLPREQVDAVYKQASVLLYPSHEGAGMVVPEVMRYAIPVVCLRNSGPGQLVHPDSQLIVKHGSYWCTTRKLANRLQQLLQDKAFAANEKQLSAARYCQLFRWSVRGEMLKNIYHYAIEKNSSRTPA
ncbi:Glycosyltransferase involved in cell wall bisynthesis [Filimonas lacunae]|uniref:Glycosyltransferase involved in cell wall bisynthesis n=1 Tax=Filimonas lacunae TaxID=477680 RepID=A0A173MH14_9BACT|nr:glycosyltransferase [Filimonas lacunae]BAV06885.1 glycosyl transferase, group 1 [Filimonas lacunae]SIS98379.1 Glycosyltransferase involved in cell wall bisynthesis [Filimonas lacunae]